MELTVAMHGRPVATVRMMLPAAVLESVDSAVSKTAVLRDVWVRVPPAAFPPRWHEPVLDAGWRPLGPVLRPRSDNPRREEPKKRMEIARELCSFEGRLAGTDAERRAANRLAERLRELGRRAEVEPTYVHPQLGLVYAAHCGLGLAGSLLSIAVPGGRLRARPVRGDVDVLRPQRPPLPPAAPVLPPRVAERRLEGGQPQRSGPGA